MTVIRFVVQAALAPDVPLRVLNLFAQQALVIDSASIEQRGDRYEIDLCLSGLPVDRAAIILEKLRAMVLVWDASMSIADVERAAAA